MLKEHGSHQTEDSMEASPFSLSFIENYFNVIHTKGQRLCSCFIRPGKFSRQKKLRYCRLQYVEQVTLANKLLACQVSEKKTFFFPATLILLAISAVISPTIDIRTRSLRVSAASSSLVLQDSKREPTRRQTSSKNAPNEVISVRVSKRERKTASPTSSLSETKTVETDTFRLSQVGKVLKILSIHIPSPVSDALVLLLATIIVVPIMRKLNTSSILGFLIAGLVLGPNGFHIVRDVVASKTLAEWGVVFFLFEMGLELSLDRLRKLQKDVFGLGLSQFLICGASFAVSAMMAGLPVETCAVIGGGLALSSSAFVLQLLSERGEIGTRFGRASFGILLLQDIAVVPLLVVIPLLSNRSGGAKALLSALMLAAMKATMALAAIFATGRLFLEKVFRTVASAKSPEAFVAVILFTVLSTSAVTEGLGLSDTLGAFLAGVLLAETKYRHQIEADIAPFRGLLLGLFFITVGFSIDMKLALANLPVVSSLVLGLLLMKAGIITALARIFGLSFSNALRTGLLVAQGGEFAFVTFGAAQRAGLLPADLSQLLLLVVALSMATTPLLSAIGSQLASHLERRRGLIGARSEDIADAHDFVIVAGFGRVGQSVCEMLNARLIRYVAFDMSPARVIEARNKGLPVFFGDACRPEVLEAAGVSRAKAVVITLDDPVAASRAVQSLRREYPELQIFVRARDTKHQQTLQLAGATAIVPELLESSLLLGGAVLLAYGTPVEEVNSLIDEARKRTFKEAGLSIGTSALNPRDNSTDSKNKKSFSVAPTEESDKSTSSSKHMSSTGLKDSKTVSLVSPTIDMTAVEERDSDTLQKSKELTEDKYSQQKESKLSMEVNELEQGNGEASKYTKASNRVAFSEEEYQKSVTTENKNDAQTLHSTEEDDYIEEESVR